MIVPILTCKEISRMEYLLRKFVPTEFSVPDSLLISVPDLLLLVLALIFLSESFL